MSTAEMQKHVYDTTGAIMRREEYAGTNARGFLVGRHRWAVHDMAGNMVCRGDNPAQCFKRWRDVTAAKAKEGAA